MGCDIHLFTETWRHGGWQKVGSIFPEPNFNPEKPANQWWCYDEQGQQLSTPHAEAHTDNCWLNNRDTTDEPYSGRNYNLFGILAGVRRYDAHPVAEPRGVPDDASAEYRAIVNRWNGDGHSHSWLTLAELQAVPWDAPYVEADDYSALAKVIEDIREHHVEGEPMPAFPRVQYRMFTRAELAEHFYTETLPRLAELGSPAEVRIVFFFDN